jgi:hypothetical protein
MIFVEAKIQIVLVLLQIRTAIPCNTSLHTSVLFFIPSQPDGILSLRQQHQDRARIRSTPSAGRLPRIA